MVIAGYFWGAKIPFKTLPFAKAHNRGVDWVKAFSGFGHTHAMSTNITEARFPELLVFLGYIGKVFMSCHTQHIPE